ncbi:MAG: mechanosensitive ion channel family protein, partial [Bacteroidetes bacterium]|nr:mechanosensitive ion channel family protein [Bacteroidota bacterium]
MSNLKHLLYDYLVSVGLTESLSEYLNMFVLLIVLIIVMFIIGFVARKILLTVFTRLSSKSKTNFDDLLVANKVPRNIAHIIPLLFALEFVPQVFFDFQHFEGIVEKGLVVFGILLTLWIVRSIL